MGTRLRQLALVARDLEPVVDDLCAVLDLEVGFRDPGVGTFGLRNAVMPVGDSFLEVVCPEKPDASAARFLDRRGGDGGYMVILQVDDLEAERKRLAEQGVRIVWELALPDIATVHLHPRDLGGAIVSLDQADPPASWRWAGPDWESHRRPGGARALRSAELQSADPRALARRWSQVLGRPAVELPAGAAHPEGALEIALDPGALRFVAERDGRGEGLCAVEIEVADPESVCAAARARGIEHADRRVWIGGVRFELAAAEGPEPPWAGHP
ncbi:MAG: VOC family protein [Myxococcota bacterium]